MKNGVIVKISLSLLVLVGTVGSAEAKNSRVRPRPIRGFVTALTPTSIQVGEKVIAISARTRFEDFFGGATDSSALNLGDCVKIKLSNGAPTPTAKEIELEDHCSVSVPGAPSRTPSPVPSSRPSDDDDDDDLGDDHGHHGVDPQPTVAASPVPTSTSPSGSHHGNRGGGHRQRGKGRG